MASSSHTEEVPVWTSTNNPENLTPPPPIPPRIATLPVPPIPPKSTSLLIPVVTREYIPLEVTPFYSNTALPDHPPYSPSAADHFCPGSGPATPFGSPLCVAASERLSVISCPYSITRKLSLPIPIPGAEESVESVVPSLSWDNFAESPVFGKEATARYSDRVLEETRKIPIVSTDYSDLESLRGSFHIGVQPPVVDHQEVVEEGGDRVFDEEVLTENSESEQDSLNYFHMFTDNMMAGQIAAGLNTLRQDIIDDMEECQLL